MIGMIEQIKSNNRTSRRNELTRASKSNNEQIIRSSRQTEMIISSPWFPSISSRGPETHTDRSHVSLPETMIPSRQRLWRACFTSLSVCRRRRRRMCIMIRHPVSAAPDQRALFIWLIIGMPSASDRVFIYGRIIFMVEEKEVCAI